MNAVRGLASVPAIDRGVVLHSGIAAFPSGIGHLAEQVSSPKLFYCLAVIDVARPPVAVFLYSAHEVVGDAHGMVGVLEEDRGVRFAVDRRIVTLLDQNMRLALFLHLGLDEFHDVGMIHV